MPDSRVYHNLQTKLSHFQERKEALLITKSGQQMETTTTVGQQDVRSPYVFFHLNCTLWVDCSFMKMVPISQPNSSLIELKHERTLLGAWTMLGTQHMSTSFSQALIFQLGNIGTKSPDSWSPHNTVDRKRRTQMKTLKRPHRALNDPGLGIGVQRRWLSQI